MESLGIDARNAAQRNEGAGKNRTTAHAMPATIAKKMCGRSHERAQDEMALCIDFREKGLIHLLRCLKPTIASLPVGDVVCTHGDNPVWVMERKTADDLGQALGGPDSTPSQRWLLLCLLRYRG